MRLPVAQALCGVLVVVAVSSSVAAPVHERQGSRAIIDLGRRSIDEHQRNATLSPSTYVSSNTTNDSSVLGNVGHEDSQFGSCKVLEG